MERPPGAEFGAAVVQDPGAGGVVGRYRVWLPVAGFVAAELCVTREGRRLTVRGRRRRSTREPDGRLAHHYRELRRDLLLPPDADLAALACTLRGHRLCLDAPLLGRPRPDAPDAP